MPYAIGVLVAIPGMLTGYLESGKEDHYSVLGMTGRKHYELLIGIITSIGTICTGLYLWDSCCQLGENRKIIVYVIAQKDEPEAVSLQEANKISGIRNNFRFTLAPNVEGCDLLPRIQNKVVRYLSHPPVQKKLRLYTKVAWMTIVSRLLPIIGSFLTAKEVILERSNRSNQSLFVGAVSIAVLSWAFWHALEITRTVTRIALLEQILRSDLDVESAPGLELKRSVRHSSPEPSEEKKNPEVNHHGENSSSELKENQNRADSTPATIYTSPENFAETAITSEHSSHSEVDPDPYACPE
ncbi:MAG: hypothetical protein AAGI90_03275 [Chlamydiota bacterium]